MKQAAGALMVLISAGMLAPVPAGAATCAEGSQCATSVLEEVVITGRRAPQQVMDASASISVIDAEALGRATAAGLADVMRSLPGIQVTDSGQPGLKRVRIRGEESRRTAILIDGQEITDHWEVGTPLSLSPLMIERVELVRGSGSVLYGSRALSGVVNFITRKGGTEPLQLEFSSTLDSATRGNDLFASAYGELDGTGYRVALTNGHHGERHSPRGRIPDTAFDNQSVYAWVGRQFGDHRLELSYDAYDAATEVYVDEEARTTFPLVDFRIDVPQRDRDKLALVYEWSDVAPWLPVVRANVHHQEHDRRFDSYSVTVIPGPAPLRSERSIASSAELEVDDGVLQFDWQPLETHYVVSGLQYTEERVDQKRHVDSLLNGHPVPAEDIHDVAAIETVALFVHDDWEIGETWRLNGGVRYYHVEGHLERTDRPGLAPARHGDTALIGALGLTRSIGDALVLRASAAQGYVYPSLLQFAIGAYAGSRFVNPNPALEPERSWSLETGLRWHRDGWMLDAGLFHSRAEDYIDHVLCGAGDGCLSSRDKIYLNVGESVASGLEASLAREAGALRPYASLTWMKRQNRYDGFQTEDSGTPALAATLGLQWLRPLALAAGTWLDLQLRGETGSRHEEPASSGAAVRERDDAWVTLDLRGGTRFGTRRRLEVILALENLADATYSTSAENLLAPERSASLRVNLALD